MSSPVSSQTMLDLVKNRRTFYELSKELTISKERLEDIVKELMLHCPTPYNAQTTRVVLLHGEEHVKLWNIAYEVMEPILSPKIGSEATTARFDQFKNSAATVLFFEDMDIVKTMQENFAFVHHKWPLWATQADGMMQYALWMALEAEGMGCNLQHYNPEIDEKVEAAFDVPSGWKLNAQLVIGGGPRASELPEKTFESLESRIKFLGA